MSCHATRRAPFAGASSVRLYSGRNHDFLRTFSRNSCIRFVHRRKIPRYPCNIPEIRWNCWFSCRMPEQMGEIHSRIPRDEASPEIVFAWMRASEFSPTRTYWFAWCPERRRSPCERRPDSAERPRCLWLDASSCRTARTVSPFPADSNRPPPASGRWWNRDIVIDSLRPRIGNESHLHMFLVVLHDSALHRRVLVRHEPVWRQIGVIGIVLGHVIAARSCAEWKFVRVGDGRTSRGTCHYPELCSWPSAPPCCRCTEASRPPGLVWFAGKRESCEAQRDEWIGRKRVERSADANLPRELLF